MSDDDPDARAEVPRTTPAELHERLRSGEAVPMLDLRDRDEFEAWPIEGADARNVPISRAVQAQATGNLAGLVAGLAEPLVAVCPEGRVSAEIAGALREAGVDATNLEGGMEGWARLLVAAELDRPDHAAATVVQYERPSSGCLSYMVHDGAVGAVVDPLRAFADRYVADADERGIELRYAVDTHVHADHVSGVRAVAERTGAEVVLPEGARDRGLAFEARTVADGDAIRVGDATLTALHAPGHTTEMTAYLVGDAGAGRESATAVDDAAGAGDQPDDAGDDAAGGPAPVLLSGDSLFLDGVARPDLEDESQAASFAGRLHETILDRLLALDHSTVLAPGHRGPDAPLADDGTYTADLGTVAGRVEALSLDREAFVDRITADAPARPANHERIIDVNLGRSEVDETESFELELGPNNCAATAD